MHVEPIGLPAALKAWREHDAEPLVTLRCGAAPDCGAEVGAVYRTPHGVVVESRTTVPEQQAPELSSADLAGMAAELGIVGLVDHEIAAATEPAREESPQTVWAQIDLLGSDLYWQDPEPRCPAHGPLRLDRAALTDAVRRHRPTYAAPPAA